MKSGIVTRILAILLLAGWPGFAAAQTYPAKPIRIVVPFPPGGIADLFSRLIGQRFSETWGQQTVIDNRTGAGGNIAAEIVAKSPPDGYTLVMGSIGTHAVNFSLFRKIPFHPVRDFTPVALVIEADGLLVVHPSVPVKSVKELIALAKNRPGQLLYASAGNGTAGHLAGELFKTMAKVNMVHVPYKGNAPAITDLLAGQTSLLFATMPTVLPHVQVNRLRAIASTGPQRSLPEVPTIAEAALPGFEVTNWIGMFAPAGTPKDVVAKLNGEIIRLTQSPEIQARLVKEGAKSTPKTPEEFGAYVRSEIDKWAKVIQASGVRVD